MTHYLTKYDSLTRQQADDKAIEDIIEYLGNTPEKIVLFAELAVLANCIEHEILCESNDGTLRKPTIQGLNMTFGFAGISGRPFHAFCRKFCFNKYVAWMTSGNDAVQLDEEGFTVPKNDHQKSIEQDQI